MTDEQGNLEYIRYEMPKSEFDKSKFDAINKGMAEESRYIGMEVLEKGNKVLVWFNFI